MKLNVTKEELDTGIDSDFYAIKLDDTRGMADFTRSYFYNPSATFYTSDSPRLFESEEKAFKLTQTQTFKKLLNRGYEYSVVKIHIKINYGV